MDYTIANFPQPATILARPGSVGRKRTSTTALLPPRSGAGQLAAGTHGSRRGLCCFALRAWGFGCRSAALRGSLFRLPTTGQEAGPTWGGFARNVETAGVDTSVDAARKSACATKILP